MSSSSQDLSIPKKVPIYYGYLVSSTMYCAKKKSAENLDLNPGPPMVEKRIWLERSLNVVLKIIFHFRITASGAQDTAISKYFGAHNQPELTQTGISQD